MREHLELYQDYRSTFLQLLHKDNSVTIYQRNLKVLVTEIFEGKNDLSPEIMKEVFKLKVPSYRLRSKGKSGNVKTTHYSISVNQIFNT